MRVLILGRLDPCLYGWRLCRRLRELGLDARIGVENWYWRPDAADWVLSRTDCDRGAFRAFAVAADVVILTPVINQPSSYADPGQWHAYREPDEDCLGDMDFRFLNRVRVALFHGSRALALHAEQYRDLYLERGWVPAATTLDYATRLGCRYFPAIVEPPEQHARLREDGEPLRTIHTPTDPAACSTGEFSALATKLGLAKTTAIGNGGIPHEECLRIRSGFHAGFDHLRGSFSISSLENAALGLVNLVGLKPACREYLRANGYEPPDWPRIESMGDVHDWLIRLRDSESETRRWQERGRAWFEQHWQPDQIARRVAAQLEEIAGGD